MTFVLPLPGRDGSIAPERPSRYSLDNLDNLVDHINSNYQVQQSLEIEEELGYGVYQTVDLNYVVVADFQLSWGDVLNKPALDSHLQWYSFDWSPTQQDWNKMHRAVAVRLASMITQASGRAIDSSRVRYSIRRKQSKGAKVYKIFIV